MQNTAVLSALETAANAAEISPEKLLQIVADTLAETACTCRDLPTENLIGCPACRTASYLEFISRTTDLQPAMEAIGQACEHVGIDVRDLLPQIVEGILDPDRCTCRDGAGLCPTCSAARDLDDLLGNLRAA
jgi:hypothetical protein